MIPINDRKVCDSLFFPMRRLVLLHSLMKQRIATSLAYNEIGPLYYDDADKEGRVTSVLENFPGLVRLKTLIITQGVACTSGRSNAPTVDRSCPPNR